MILAHFTLALGPSLNGRPWPLHWWQLSLPQAGAMTPRSLRWHIVFVDLKIFWQ